MSIEAINYRTLNIRSKDEILSALAADGHGRLEGAYFENHTINRLLLPLLGDTITTGWWFASSSQNRFHLFRLYTGRLSATDIRFIHHILQNVPHITPHLVRYDFQEGRLIYSARTASFGSTGDFVDAEQFIAGLALAEINRNLVNTPPVVPQPGRTDKARLDKALMYIQTLDIRKLVAERMFANQILNQYFKYIYDLDAAGIYRDKIVGFELKRKYPEPATEYGINAGLVRFFRQLAPVLPICHIVLNSACWNKYTSPFIIFERPDIADRTVWIGAELSTQLLNRSTGSATVGAADFGIGDIPKTTPKFSVTEFSFISGLVNPDVNGLRNLLDGSAGRIAQDFLSSLRVQNC